MGDLDRRPGEPRDAGEDGDLGDLGASELVRALRSSGTEAELADQERYLELFRTGGAATGGGSPASGSVTALRRRSPVARRLGAGTTLGLAVVVAASGGVAAAYTGHLPDRLQSIAHHVFVGAPAVPAENPALDAQGQTAKATPTRPTTSAADPTTTQPPGPATTGPTRTPAPTGPSAPAPTHAGRHRDPGAPTSPGPAPSTPPAPPAPPATSGPAPTATATAPGKAVPPTSAPPPSASPEPTATGSSSPPAKVVPAAVSIAAPAHEVDAGQSSVFSGVVTDADGNAVPDVRVALQVLDPRGWRPVAHGVSDDSGAVSLSSPAAQQTAAYRLLTRHQVHSDPWRLAERPLLSASVTVTGESAVIDVSTQGATPGNPVALVTRRDGQVVVVGRATLDADGSATFQVTPERRHARYTVVLSGTRQHLAARAPVRVDRQPG